MPIQNDVELAEAAHKVGVLQQEIQDYLVSKDESRAPSAFARWRFPRGFLRTATALRANLPFVRDANLKSNMAYTIILMDVVWWVRVRTDLWGTPKEMLLKLYVFLVGTLVESITKDYLHGLCGKSFDGRAAYLLEHKVISPELKAELEWLWDTRNRMHLFKLDDIEYINDYNEATQTRAIKTYRELASVLTMQGRLN